jgi:hypothetical protein
MCCPADSTCKSCSCWSGRHGQAKARSRVCSQHLWADATTCPAQHGRHDAATGCRFDGMRPHAHPCTCPPGTGDGYRVAHCHTGESPYSDTGYIVVEHT